MPEDSRNWHMNAFEALKPLRYHMFQLLSDLETHKIRCEALGMPFGLRTLEAALVAMDDVEIFFTGSKVEGLQSLRTEAKHDNSTKE
jgi:hypothetical protein